MKKRIPDHVARSLALVKSELEKIGDTQGNLTQDQTVSLALTILDLVDRWQRGEINETGMTQKVEYAVRNAPNWQRFGVQETMTRMTERRLKRGLKV